MVWPTSLSKMLSATAAGSGYATRRATPQPRCLSRRRPPVKVLGPAQGGEAVAVGQLGKHAHLIAAFVLRAHSHGDRARGEKRDETKRETRRDEERDERSATWEWRSHPEIYIKYETSGCLFPHLTALEASSCLSLSALSLSALSLAALSLSALSSHPRRGRGRLKWRSGSRSSPAASSSKGRQPHHTLVQPLSLPPPFPHIESYLTPPPSLDTHARQAVPQRRRVQVCP